MQRGSRGAHLEPAREEGACAQLPREGDVDGGVEAGRGNVPDHTQHDAVQRRGEGGRLVHVLDFDDIVPQKQPDRV